MKIYYVDSFTDQPFKGNPAAVVLQDNLLSDNLMQNIAQEIGFSETAFLFEDKKGNYSLRWFTPSTEVGLCGHATLASAKVFFTYIQPEKESIIFSTKYGELTCYQENDQIRMDFPRDISQKVLKSSEIKDFFAFPLKELILISNVNHYLTLFVDDTVKLSELKIDFNKIVLLDRIVPEISGLIISNQHNGIVGMRFFDPWEGIPEDPVTGSAALVVAEYWFELFKRDYLEIEQMSDRGGKMSVKKNKNSLSITGTATIILEGKMMVGKYGK